MHLNPDYSLQSIAKQHFIFIKNNEQVDLTRIISLNPSAAWLWTQLEKREFTHDEAVKLLIEHFDVDHSTASCDVKEWLEVLRGNDLLQE